MRVKPPPSRMLADLQKDLVSGKKSALDRFWEQVTSRGTPLIEPIPDDPQHYLVTFLWREKEPIQNIVVAGGIAAWEFKENQMAPLPGSDVWYKCYRVASDVRAEYCLAPNDPLTPLDGPEDSTSRLAHFIPDPLNLNQIHSPADDEGHNGPGQATAYVVLPDAPSQPWSEVHPDRPRGKVEMQRIRSRILWNERRVWIYTPPDYSEKDGPLNLLLMLDGWSCLHELGLPNILDNLLAEQVISPLIAVMPDSLGLDGTRSRELPCHPPFAQFIRAELIPWIKDLYPITSDPSRNIAAGFSYGGLAAAYLAFRHPDVFGNFISLSGSFYWKPKDDPEPGWLISQFAEQPLRDLKYFIAAGLLETFKPFGGPSVLEAGRKMVSVLKAKGYQGRFIEFNGGHNEVCWRGLIPDALHFLGGNRDAKT